MCESSVKIYIIYTLHHTLGLIFCFPFEKLLDHLISGKLEIINTPKISFHSISGIFLDFPCTRVPHLVGAVPRLAHIELLAAADRRGLLGEEQRQGRGRFY